jgi:hypothetical protein
MHDTGSTVLVVDDSNVPIEIIELGLHSESQRGRVRTTLNHCAAIYRCGAEPADLRGSREQPPTSVRMSGRSERHALACVAGPDFTAARPFARLHLYRLFRQGLALAGHPEMGGCGPARPARAE